MNAAFDVEALAIAKLVRKRDAEIAETGAAARADTLTSAQVESVLRVSDEITERSEALRRRHYPRAAALIIYADGEHEAHALTVSPTARSIKRVWQVGA